MLTLKKNRQDISQLRIPNTHTMTESDTDKADVLLNNFSSVFTEEPIGPIPEANQQQYRSIVTRYYAYNRGSSRKETKGDTIS